MPLKPDSKTGLRRQIEQLEMVVKTITVENSQGGEALEAYGETIDQLQSDLDSARYSLEQVKQRNQQLLRMVRELTEMVK